MMRSTVLHDTRRFVCHSYGNGLTYTLEHRSSHRAILLQSTDAVAFREELDKLTCGRLPISYDEALGVLWNDYEQATKIPPKPTNFDALLIYWENMP